LNPKWWVLLTVGWYLRFALSYRDVEELLGRGPTAEVKRGRSRHCGQPGEATVKTPDPLSSEPLRGPQPSFFKSSNRDRPREQRVQARLIQIVWSGALAVTATIFTTVLDRTGAGGRDFWLTVCLAAFLAFLAFLGQPVKYLSAAAVQQSDAAYR
jgi:hypothetical protein